MLKILSECKRAYWKIKKITAKNRQIGIAITKNIKIDQTSNACLEEFHNSFIIIKEFIFIIRKQISKIEIHYIRKITLTKTIIKWKFSINLEVSREIDSIDYQKHQKL
jgi:hypothetical protein